MIEKKTAIFSTWKLRIVLVGVLLITGLIYLQTSKFSFVYWDDDQNIKTETSYSVFSSENFLHHYKTSRYKALAIWSFIIDNAVFGKKPGWYHLHNVLLHLVNILLLYFLMQRITKKETVALITATLFAVHPAFIEPVAWVTGRKDLLFVLFLLLSVITYRNYLLKKQPWIWLLLVIIFTYLASLAKIQAFVLPMLFLGFDWFYKRKFSVLLIIEKLLLVLLMYDKWKLSLLIVLIVLLIFIFNIFIKPKKSRFITASFWYLVIMTVLVVGFTAFYFSVNHYAQRIVFTIPVVFLLVFTGVFMLLIMKKNEFLLSKTLFTRVLKPAIVLIPLIIFFTELIIIHFSNIGFLNNIYIVFKTVMPMNFDYLRFWETQSVDYNSYTFAERLILFPNTLLFYIGRFFLAIPLNPMVAYPAHTAGGGLETALILKALLVYVFLLVSAFIIYKYFRKSRLALLGLIWFTVCISIVLQLISIEGRILAADRYAYPSYIGLFLVTALAADKLLQRFRPLYVWTTLVALILSMSILTYLKCDTWKNSVTLWQEALDKDPKNHYAWFSLGYSVYFENNKPKEALKYFDKAISLYTENFHYFNNRGRIRFAIQDFQGAMDDFNEAIKMNSLNWGSYYNRGVLLMEYADFKGAAEDFRKAKEIFPEFTLSDSSLKKAMQMVRLDSILNSGGKINESDTEAMKRFIRGTGRKFGEHGMYEKAVVYLEKGIEIFPEEPSFYEYLAVTYNIQHNYPLSLESYNRGLKRIPGNPALLFARGNFYQMTGESAKACADWQLSAQGGNMNARSMVQQHCGFSLMKPQ
ncbi:MAG: tetratricopeptide repeat protein [Bacteroidales bacterium]|jgi:tetratricopeptide (TPR) repeat protein|nr:tetratricopeptide repeat protein [Bacteroidales bacterium]